MSATRKSHLPRLLGLAAALALLGLAGCVAYPAYDTGYYGGYYAPGYAYAPPVTGQVVIGSGWGWGGGWHHRRHWGRW